MSEPSLLLRIVCVIIVYIGIPTIILLKVISGIPDYEKLFERMHLYWFATMLRDIKALFIFTSYDKQMEQVNWTHEMNALTRQKHMLEQRDIFLKELVIEYATKDKLHEISKLANDGPEDWKQKLDDQKMRMQIHQNHVYEHFARAPDGYIIREWKMRFHRANKTVRKDPIRCILEQELVDACKARGGCCKRKCQCCSKARGLSVEGRLIYTHCTLYCGCCIRDRGFTYRDPEHGAGIPGFVDHAKEAVSIENASGTYHVK